jgi:hypothetical protein
MKKIILVFLGFCVVLTVYAQKITIKKGTILKYKINDVKDFIITFTNVGKTVSFTWQRISDEDTTSGTVRINEKALATSRNYINSFADDSHLKLTDASTVILSKLNFTELLKKQKTRMSPGNYDPMQGFKNETKKMKGETVKITINGVLTEIKPLVAVKQSDESNFIVSTKECNFPLILAMKLDFDINLEEVIQ